MVYQTTITDAVAPRRCLEVTPLGDFAGSEGKKEDGLAIKTTPTRDIASKRHDFGLYVVII